MRYYSSIVICLLVLFSCTENNNSAFTVYTQYDSYSIEALRQQKAEVLLEERTFLKNNSSGFTEEKIAYSTDGLLQYAHLSVPDGEMPASGFPAVVILHGYIAPDKYSTEKSYRLVTSYYAKKGFTVIKPDYRGHDRSEAGDMRRPFSTFGYTMDILGLLTLLPEIPEVDMDNLFLYGHSMGGDLALRILETRGEMFKAASIWAPVVGIFPENRLYFLRKRDPRAAGLLESYTSLLIPEEKWPDFSPISNINLVETPIILHHGTEDESCPFLWSLQLAAVLDTFEKEYVFYRYEGDDHNFARGNFYTVLARDVAYFRGYMKK